MVKLSFVFLMAVLLVFFGCKNEKDSSKVVKLEPTINKKLTLGKVSDIIQLETSKESMIDFLSEVNIDLLNNRIFVKSDFNVFIFDVEGKFILKLKKGKGPGEINMIFSFSLDTKNKKIYAIDSGNSICVFDYKGNLLSKQMLENFYSSDIYSLNDENVLLHCYNVGKTERNFVGMYNFNEMKVVRKFIHAEESPYPSLVFLVGNNFTTSGNRLFFARTNIFGLFEFKADSFQRILTYDMGGREVPESFKNQYIEQNRITFREDAIERNFVPYIMNSFHFNNHYLVIVDDKNYSCYAIDENNKNKIYMNGRLSAYFNLPNVESLRLPTRIQDDMLIFSCAPIDFFGENPKVESKEIEIDGRKMNVRYDANPFLIIVE